LLQPWNINNPSNLCNSCACIKKISTKLNILLQQLQLWNNLFWNTNLFFLYIIMDGFADGINPLLKDLEIYWICRSKCHHRFRRWYTQLKRSIGITPYATATMSLSHYRRNPLVYLIPNKSLRSLCIW